MSATNPRPSYYSQILIDPNNDRRIWVLGASIYTSEDGGKTFKTDVVDKIHGDFHAIWIDPANSDHMLLGSDGGIHSSLRPRPQLGLRQHLPARAVLRGGARHRSARTTSTAGCRTTAAGCGPSAHARPAGHLERRVVRAWAAATASTACSTRRTRTSSTSRARTATSRGCSARPASAGSSGPSRPRERSTASTGTRRSWSRPTIHQTIYYGGNQPVRLARPRRQLDAGLARPHDERRREARRHADLRQDREGAAVAQRRRRALRDDHHDQRVAAASAGVLWVGTDDGNLQVSRDGGATWTNVTARVPGVPKGTYVSRVEASRSGEGAAYVAFDGHRGNDFGVYLFFTSDYGQTWNSVSANIPAGGTIHVVREHPQQRGRALRRHRARAFRELGPRRLVDGDPREEPADGARRRRPDPRARGRSRARDPRARGVDPRRRAGARLAPEAAARRARARPDPHGDGVAALRPQGQHRSQALPRAQPAPRARSSRTGSLRRRATRTRSRSR